MQYSKWLFLFLAYLYLFNPCLSAQEVSDDKHENFVQATLGYSPVSVYLLGKTPNSKTYYSYIGTGYKLESRILDLDTYITFGLIPQIEFDYEKRDNEGRRDFATGFGVSPVGLVLHQKKSPKLSFNYGLRSGVVYMNKNFPTDKGKRLNYGFDLSFSFEYQAFEQTSLLFGYRFQHVSNAQTGFQNPGIDSNIIFISFKKYNYGN